MDVIGMALVFAVRMTIMLVQMFFSLSDWITSSFMGDLYRRSRAGAWVAMLLIWVVVWVVILSIISSSNAAPGGVLFGLIWAVILMLRNQGDWDEQIAFLQEQEDQQPEMFHTPLLPIQEGKPAEVVDEFDESELTKKV